MMSVTNLRNLPDGEGAVQAPVRRRRPGDTQREQKEVTRRKLLNAARVVFEHHPYYATAVEMLADQAGVSRTTFYRHFDGKLAVATALFDDLAPVLKEKWRELFAIPTPAKAEVKVWLNEMVAVSVSHRVLVSLFSQIEASEPESGTHKYEYYDEIFAMLDLNAREVGAATVRRLRAKFLLVMLQLDQFLYLTCSGTEVADRRDLLDAMAEILVESLGQARAARRS